MIFKFNNATILNGEKKLEDICIWFVNRLILMVATLSLIEQLLNYKIRKFYYEDFAVTTLEFQCLKFNNATL